jgi:hypothetical protein
MTRLYFAHPVSDFGTEFEAQVVAALTAAGYEVVNPNSPEHQAGYAERGFKYTKEVRAGCDAVAFLRFPSLFLGSGVAAEVADFRKRELPVFEINPFNLTLIPHEGVPLKVLDPQFTREETALMKARPNGGRDAVAGSEAA